MSIIFNELCHKLWLRKWLSYMICSSKFTSDQIVRTWLMFFFLVSENSLPLLLRCLYGRFFFPKIPILGQKYFLFSQVLLLQIVLYPSSFQRLIIINSDIDLLKTAFWQTANWSQCWKFYSDQTRMKSLLRRLKNVISMVS